MKEFPDNEPQYWRDIRVHDNHITVILRFGILDFAASYADLLKSAYNGRQHIYLDFSSEASAFVLGSAESENDWVYLQIHKLIDATGIPYKNFSYYSGNVYNQQSYDGWRLAKNVTEKMLCAKHRQQWAHIVVDSHKDCSYKYDANRDTIRPYYFTCLNGAPRAHRFKTLLHLWDNNLFPYGIISYVSSDPRTYEILNNMGYSELASKLPLSVDNYTEYYTIQSHQDKLSDAFYNIYDQTYFDVTTETLYGEGTSSYNSIQLLSMNTWWKEMFFTEKTYRSIFYKRPFLLFGSQYQLKMLRRFGFKTFDGILFDESYDNIANWEDRLKAIMSETKRICSTQTLKEIHRIVYSPEMEDILNHNYNLLRELGPKHEAVRFFRNLSS